MILSVRISLLDVAVSIKQKHFKKEQLLVYEKTALWTSLTGLTG